MPSLHDTLNQDDRLEPVFEELVIGNVQVVLVPLAARVLDEADLDPGLVCNELRQVAHTVDL